MRRGLFTISSAISLLLCIAVCTLWIRSYWLGDTVTWANADGHRRIRTASGSLSIHLALEDWSTVPARFQPLRYQRDDWSTPMNWHVFLSPNPGNVHTSWEFAGFAWYQLRNTRTGARSVISVTPFWSLALVTAVPPLIWVTRRLRDRRRRAQAGLCPTCGYDLRATPDRCPECGASPSHIPAPAALR